MRLRLRNGELWDIDITTIADMRAYQECGNENDYMKMFQTILTEFEENPLKALAWARDNMEWEELGAQRVVETYTEMLEDAVLEV